MNWNSSSVLSCVYRGEFCARLRRSCVIGPRFRPTWPRAAPAHGSTATSAVWSRRVRQSRTQRTYTSSRLCTSAQNGKGGWADSWHPRFLNVIISQPVITSLDHQVCKLALCTKDWTCGGAGGQKKTWFNLISIYHIGSVCVCSAQDISKHFLTWIILLNHN